MGRKVPSVAVKKSKSTQNRSFKRLSVAAVCAAYFILAIGYNVASPPFEGSEERNQFRYVRYLIEKRSLPALEQGKPSESHQPPLYYTLAALLTGWIETDDFPTPVIQDNPFRGYHYWQVGVDNKNQFLHGPWTDPRFSPAALAVRLIRGLSAALGLGTLLLTYWLAREVMDEHSLALGAMAWVAFNPMFLYISGSMGNDSAAALTGAAILLATARLVRRGLTDGKWLGLALGLGWLSKITVVFLLPAVELGLTWTALSQRSWRAWLRANLIALGIALALSGWMFVRNVLLYGDPTGVGRDLEVWGIRSLQDGLAVLPDELRFAWTTFWGRFGWGEVPLPSVIYDALYAPTALAVIGLIVYFVQARPDRSLRPVRSLLIVVLLAAVGTLIAALVWYTLYSATGNFGRYTFPALSAAAVLFVWGWANLAPRRGWPGLVAACVISLLALAVYALLGVLRPAYAPPAPLTALQRSHISHPLDVTLGDRARLLGYDLDRARAAPGERIHLTLYWESLAPFDRNYALFVHVLSEAGPLIAQRDTHPGLGRYPTRAWQVGSAFADRVPIDVPQTAYAPDRGAIAVGLYDPETGQRLAVPGVPEGLVRLAPFELIRPSAEYPLAVNFGEITLVDYELSQRSLAAGRPLTVTLYWQPASSIQYDYNVFAHVLGEANQMWAADDGLPHVQPERTSQWLAGQVYKDVRVLRLAPDTPPGLYPIEMGLFGGPTGDRLPILDDGGHQLDDRVFLTQIRVTAP